MTGLVGYNLMSWAIETSNKDLLNWWQTTHKRIYGLVQISVGKKHYEYKIVVNLLSDKEYKYSVRKGSKEICKANSLTSALKTLESVIKAMLEYDKSLSNIKKLIKKELIKQRLDESKLHTT